MKFIYISVFLLSIQSMMGQNFQGKWSGKLTQKDSDKTFVYSIELEQSAEKVFGTAQSQNEDGGGLAKFEIGGIWDGQTLTIQEVEQLEPPNARWCLKHIRLVPAEENGTTLLKGTWQAEGCTPGTLVLRQEGSPSSRPANTAPSPYSVKIPGKFTGTLSQSDRDYGFFFEMQLNENGTGTSTITSDGEGGNATQQLLWTFDHNTDRLFFEELLVNKKSVSDWPWCLKTGYLNFKNDENRLSLTGGWTGYIEGYDPKSGPCAPGKVYLERPIFKKEEVVVEKRDNEPIALVPQGVQTYEHKEKRDVQVDRVLEVHNNVVRVRVWDNGVVDGDVLSLFVNGEIILENYRVTRRKHETIVKLDEPTNYLILHALNLGSISPNTVAVSVDDGIEEQVVIMSSNLKKSGAVMIRQFTVGNQ